MRYLLLPACLALAALAGCGERTDTPAVPAPPAATAAATATTPRTLEVWALVRSNVPFEKMKAAMEDSAVHGLVFYTSLARVAKQPDAYDWSQIDAALDLCRSLRKPVKLAIIGGRWVPAWLYEKGAAKYTWTHTTTLVDAGSSTASAPLPWDETYLATMSALAMAAGDRYRDDAQLVEVQVTGPALANGLEMNLSMKPADAQAHGYTPERFAAAWTRMIDAWSAAFPRQRIAVALHNALIDQRTDTVARQVRDYAWSTLGPRFAPNVFYLTDEAWFARGNNAVDAWAEMAGRTAISAQLIDIYSVKRKPPASVRVAAAKAAALGATAIEVFVDDILAKDYRDQLVGVELPR